VITDSVGVKAVPWAAISGSRPGSRHDHLDAAEVLREDWRQQTTEYDDYDEEDQEYQDDDFARSIAEQVAPFSRRQFPGLAQAEDHQLDAGQFDRVLVGPGPCRPGARRPAR
jgi:hypothetical protein